MKAKNKNQLRLLKPNRSQGKQFPLGDFFTPEPKLDRRHLGPSCDLYVPEDLIEQLDEMISRIGSIRVVLHNCLEKNRSHSRILLHSLPSKISYQERHLKSKRFPFRPFAGDWSELRKISMYHGVSMCKMFATMLESELYPRIEHAANSLPSEMEDEFSEFPFDKRGA
ncbi:DUF1564 family protein [Leptospira gomenensis]|uniref:DUF1564 family protein n=1 Tax=Leptospira gomenensis TaxID=2484974 RepID=A0A5F1YA45_9LEPT|nr:DUF1564 family protein [Leptospira gomenensis]TGK36150.1 DUF1564 family protein [Leptospira gomenensis]TGK40433.1 DUF1564 family protein [Leptospira gomenensis]TGK65969.1 DUF1564 family protein [Leptospira gomenensis]